jgi:multidrug transporter EmrE-like cation transporter
MSWLYLIAAGLLEIAWASTLKKTAGFTRLGPSVVTAVLYMASLYLLSLGLRDLPASSGYAVWVGIGAVGTAGLDHADRARGDRVADGGAWLTQGPVSWDREGEDDDRGKH